MDQADTLRKLMQQRQTQARRTVRAANAPKVVTLASGKGGVGKSCLAATLGSWLAREGQRVLLVDGDFGLANLDILLNVQPVATLEQVLRGSATIQEAVVGVERNLWLLPAASGLMDYKQADSATRERIVSVFDEFPWEMDFILLDAGAGVQDNVVSLHRQEFESVVVLTPEPTSLADAYGLIKVLRRQAGIRQISVVVNQVADGREGTQAFQRLKEVAARFVDVQLEYLGHWQHDEKVVEAVMKRKILLDLGTGASSTPVSVPSLQLLAKRFQLKFSGRSDDRKSTVRQGYPATEVAGASLRVDRVEKMGRLRRESLVSGTSSRNETAQVAPGNTAGFFRSLLGEVKA